MALVDTPLVWRAATNAISTTQYELHTDEAVPGTFALKSTVNATTNPAGSLYAPIETTLSGALTKTQDDITLASGANINAADYVEINNKEIALLGTKSTATYAPSARGASGTIAVAHVDGVTVYHCHESTTISNLPFEDDNVHETVGRRLIRINIKKVDSADASIQTVMRQVPAYYPSEPPSQEYCTVYGDIDRHGVPQANLGGTYNLTNANTYIPSTGETISHEPYNFTTSAEGYWELYLPKADYVEGSVEATITIDVGEDGTPITHNITTVPNQRYAHIYECV